MRRLLVPLSVLLLLPACTQSPVGGTAPVPDEPVVEAAWAREDLSAVTRPVAVGGSVLLYAASGGVLSLVSLEPENGTTRWSTPATDATITAGVELSVTVIGDDVVYLRPGTQAGRGHVTRVGADDGRQRWTDEHALAYVDMPQVCDEDFVCAAADRRGDDLRVRLRLTDGAFEETAEGTSAGRRLGGDVVDTGERVRDVSDVLEGVTAGGERLWRRPAIELFGVPVTSDRGWYLDQVGDVVVGHLGTLADPYANPGLELSRHSVMAGFEHDTGKPLWNEPGVVFRCGMSDVVAVDGTAFRCRSTGLLLESGPATEIRSTVEGFDPRTGRTTWSVDVGLLPVLGLQHEQGPLTLGGDRVVLSGDGRHLLLDLGDGRSEEVDGDTAGWCLEPAQGVALTENGARDGGHREVEGRAVPCTADRRVGVLPSTLEGAAGAVVDDVVVWATDEGVQAARQVSGPRPSPSATSSPGTAATRDERG